jgi:tRNA G10  N-methylase Trm11
MSKHDAMKAYLEEKVQSVVGNALSFNVSLGTPETIAFITEYSDKIIKKYLRSGATKAYGFAILITKQFSEGTDDLNLLAMNMAQDFNDWIDSQNKAKAFPDFGSKCQVQKIESLQNMPNLAAVNMETATAKYMLQCRVTYFEEV